MNTWFVVGTIYGVAILFCLLTTFYLRARFHTQMQQLRKQVELVSQQLEELYGPLELLCLECHHIASTLQHMPLPPAGLVYEFQLDETFFSNLQKIVDLVAQKAHLLQEKKFPKGFPLFLLYQREWLKQVRDQGTTLLRFKEWHADLIWPQPFSEEILASYQDLRQQHAILLQGTFPKRKFSQPEKALAS